jgi:multicomponent K+:H+ antiporter subunit A
MAAPTPVSAYLHSATMVKAGVFLLARLWPVLAGTDEWFWLVTSSGLITLLIGGFAAIFQHDLKGLLAYSTISHLGLITTAAGPQQPAGRRGRGVPHPQPRHLQGLAVHGRGHHRPRNRHA